MNSFRNSILTFFFALKKHHFNNQRKDAIIRLKIIFHILLRKRKPDYLNVNIYLLLHFILFLLPSYIVAPLNEIVFNFLKAKANRPNKKHLCIIFYIQEVKHCQRFHKLFICTTQHNYVVNCILEYKTMLRKHVTNQLKIHVLLRIYNNCYFIFLKKWGSLWGVFINKKQYPCYVKNNTNTNYQNQKQY